MQVSLDWRRFSTRVQGYFGVLIPSPNTGASALSNTKVGMGCDCDYDQMPPFERSLNHNYDDF